jgi:hypothetical protein
MPRARQRKRMNNLGNRSKARLGEPSHNFRQHIVFASALPSPILSN